MKNTLPQKISCLLLAALAAFAPPLYAQPPDLRPGEGLAVISRQGEVSAWGDAASLSPMGNLAKILWLSLEADDWEAFGLEHRCRGELNGVACPLPKGHGRVDVPKSFKDDCNVSFSIWVNLSRERWKREYGDGGARHRLNNVFAPFLGDRLPREPALPPMFSPEWYAEGQLLQASPELLAQWLAKPAQERLLATCRKYMLGFSDFIRSNSGRWWIKTSEAPALQAQGQASAQKQIWAVGSNGTSTAVLRLPPGIAAKDAQTRFRKVMNIQGR